MMKMKQIDDAFNKPVLIFNERMQLMSPTY